MRSVRTKFLIVFFTLYILTLTFFPSIVNRTPQIESKLLFTAIGIDETEDEQVEFSGIIVLPDSGGEAQCKSQAVSYVAPSLSEAIERIGETYGKTVELDLCGLVVIGESLKDKNVLTYLNYLDASSAVSPGVYLIRCVGSKAKECLSLAAGLNPSQTGVLSSIIDYNSTSCTVATITLLEFLSEHSSRSASSVIPEVIISEEKGKTGEGGDESKQSAFKSMDETSIINSEGKVVGYFDKNETIAYNLLKSDKSRGVITIDDFIYDGVSLGDFHLPLYEKSSKKSATWKDGKPVALLYISATLSHLDRHRILEYVKQTGKSEASVTDALAQKVKEQIENSLLSACQKSFSLSADCFLIENQFYRQTFSQYKKYGKENTAFLSDVIIRPSIKVNFK